MYTPPYLQPYKGNASRFSCPACETKHSFTLYLDGNTNEPINAKVGKCNRESKCGYHYTPKQFFIDNPLSFVETWHATSKIPMTTKQIILTPPQGTIPFSYVDRSSSYQSNFIRFLCEFMTIEQMKWIGENYALGATKNKEVIFWQIDITGKVRTGKIMQYNSTTGRRIKHESGAIDWVHNKMKKAGTLPKNYNLQQCFFGEHLLQIYPEKPVAIVESEKSAIIASVVIPDSVWIAAGQLNGLSIEKAKVLKGRKVTLFPDLGGFEKWTVKATEIKQSVKCEIKVSTILEDIATETQRSEGLDIADYIIEELRAKTKTEIIKSRFSKELQSMIEENPALLILIDRLELEELTR